MTNLNKYFVLLFALCCITACSHTKKAEVAYPLPPNNLNSNSNYSKVNTANNDVSVFQIKTADGLQKTASSSNFFESFFGESFIKANPYFSTLSGDVESVSLLDDNSGFIALSHAPSKEFTQLSSLPLSGDAVGGTDIYYFVKNANSVNFSCLGSGINSKYWDSHPNAVKTDDGAVILLWSTDRKSPFHATTSERGNIIAKGNCDIYYSFRINGAWSQAKMLDTSINRAESDEVSPSLTCISSNPTLYFSSNRAGDFDIYRTPITINTKNALITVNSEAESFAKTQIANISDGCINTNANEMFPQIDDGGNLILASDRFSSPTLTSTNTTYSAGGKYDLYEFNGISACAAVKNKKPAPIEAPKPTPTVTESVNPNANVKLIVAVKNGTNPKEPVFMPVIKIFDMTENAPFSEIKGKSIDTFALKAGHKYEVFAGSEMHISPCSSSEDRVMQYYNHQIIARTDTSISPRSVRINYDSTISDGVITLRDTAKATRLQPAEDEEEVKPTIVNTYKSGDTTITVQEDMLSLKIRKCTRFADTSAIEADSAITANKTYASLLEVQKQIITTKVFPKPGKIVQKSKQIIVYDTTYKTDSQLSPAIGAEAPSELTRFEQIYIPHSTGDSTIRDEVLLYPQYFEKPLCSWSFDSLQNEFKQNVPYFQTAFWKVNTGDSLNSHINQMKSDGYLASATYIDLHPRNARYGYQTQKHASRVAQYVAYSQQVDRNIGIMCKTINKYFIPSMEQIDTLENRNSQIIIKLEAFSDSRDAGTCGYVGDQVDYIGGKLLNKENIELQKVSLSNGVTLGDDNDNLSKLRVFYGFKTIYQKLLKDANFKKYADAGLIFDPTSAFSSTKEAMDKLEKCKIVFLLEGKRADPVVQEKVEGYDPVRRINLEISHVTIDNGRATEIPCCRKDGKIKL